MSFSKATGNPSLFRGEMIPAAALGALSIGGFSAFLTAKMIVLNLLQKKLTSTAAVCGAKVFSVTAARQTAINAASKSTMALSGLKILTGPIGWTITGLWTANDIASTAFRVTIPAVIYISAIRCVYINKDKNN